MKYLLSIPIVIAIMVAIPGVAWGLAKFFEFVVGKISENFTTTHPELVIFLVIAFIALYILAVTCPAWK